jgi:hypothetical protein
MPMNHESSHPLLLSDLGPLFGSNFMSDHAGHIMSDARIAVVELVANSYDAGATKVHVSWPDAEGGFFTIKDDGTGMTREEFGRRWRMLKYNRMQEQGAKVQFPKGVKLRERRAFGQNGKGRHGAFCFSDTYTVETWRDGRSMKAEVSLVSESNVPFHCAFEPERKKVGHGTEIVAKVTKNWIKAEAILETLGSRFLVDPDFTVSLNGERIVLEDLSNTQAWDVEVPGFGIVKIRQIDSTTKQRTTHMRGITWWVYGKKVGESSWDDLGEYGAILDGRTAAAKTYSFIIEADLLKEEVKADWSGFNAGARFNSVRDAAVASIIQALKNLFKDIRKERKEKAIEKAVDSFGSLTKYSQRVVQDFIDEVQVSCPRLTDADLFKTVGIFTKMEESRSGYDLLNQLVACSPEDLDRWNDIMRRWDAKSAEIILGELDRRLRLIQKIQSLVHNPTTDELHDLQPLFEKGLWIFGPEFDSVDFCSNRGMSTVIRKFLKMDSKEEPTRKRMDFIALPDTSLGVYTADTHDGDSEVSGYRKVLIVELKRGGFELTQRELDQGRDYGLYLVKQGVVPQNTPICVFVLGARWETGLGHGNQVNVMTTPLTYDVALSKAHARTFRLLKKIEAVRGDDTAFTQPEVLGEHHPVLDAMFKEDAPVP